LPLVYDELRRLARAKLSGESAQQTLQPTALVHEVWLKLVGENHAWANREHFFRVAAEAMRRILIDRARRRHRLKRGPNLERVPIEELDIALVFDDDRLLRVNEALNRLTVEDPLKAELVKLRFFVGFRIDEAAEALGISATSAKRYWNYARAWLLDALSRED
jgi:RNA polymerase sigma factor (TIGR02999 family)